MKRSAILGLVICVLACGVGLAQSTQFTYQGMLQNSGTPAAGNYDFEFLLFDSFSGGIQIGSTQTRNSVAVSNGTFSTSLDFGAQFPGANRFLEIRVRQTGQPTLTTLVPRQQINSNPYSVKSLTANTATSATSADSAVNATNAVTAATATNALQLGGVAANQYVQLNGNGSGLTNLNAANISSGTLSNTRLGVVPVANGGTGSATQNFVDLTSAQTVGGNKTFSNTLSGNAVNSVTQYNIGGQRVMFSHAGTSNVFAGHGTGAVNTGPSNSFVGFNAGLSNTTGGFNSFFGRTAGLGNTTGATNSFFGVAAGGSNTTGSNNSFFGVEAGFQGTDAFINSFFGHRAGYANTASANSFFGGNAGENNSTGFSNAFFGQGAGVSNTTGSNQVFFGVGAGGSNTNGGSNSFFGRSAGGANTSGSANTIIGSQANVASGDLNYATAIGAFAVVGASDSIVLGKVAGNYGGVGRPADTVHIPGNLNVAGVATFSGTLGAGIVNATTQYNIGGIRVLSNAGQGNLFAGRDSGTAQTSGFTNSFFGAQSGQSNTSGGANSFFGFGAGQSTTTSFNNSFFGTASGQSNISGGNNSFFGAFSGGVNTGGISNSYFGSLAGGANTNGSLNSFYGMESGNSNTTGSSNSFFGYQAGTSNTTGSNNTLIGNAANVAANNLTFATAIGANATVSQSNSVVLGSISGQNGATSSANVGIGTSAPAFKLQVNDSSNTGLRVETGAAGGSVASFGGLGSFSVDAPFIPGGRLSIKENGNVGVGTNNPNAKLQIAGGSVYIQNPNSLIITSPNGACWFITVNNAGALSTISVACP